MFIPTAVYKSRVLILSALISLTLNGCSVGGGGVELDSVEIKPTIIKPKPPAPSKDEVVDVPEKNNDLPKYGFAFKNPTARYVENKKEGKKWYEKFIENPNLVFGNGKEAKEAIMNLRPEDIYVLNNSSSLEEVVLIHPIYQTDENGKVTVKFVEKKITNLKPDDTWFENGDLVVNEDENVLLLNFDHTQLGFIGYEHTKFSTEGTLSNATLFYRGIDRAQSLPISLKANYTGKWVYMRPLSYYEAQNGEGGGYTGQNLSAYKGNTSFNATFDIDFGKKTLTGQLKSKNKKTEEEKYYFDISAKIEGNQFTGKATSKQQDDEILSKDSDVLHGNFYGEKGEELGGAFYSLADKNKPNGDKTLAVAFIAKRKNDEKIETEQLTSSKQLLWKNTSGKVDTIDLGYVDDIMQLNIIAKNGKVVTLDVNSKNQQQINSSVYAIDACCDNFQFMRFGGITSADNNANTNNSTASNLQESLFIQGYLTPTSEVPTSIEAHYVGKWKMRTIVNPVNSNDSDISYEIKGDAVYKAHFGDKKLTGSLVGDGGVTDQGTVHSGRTPWVNINADIKGNQFFGTAIMPEIKTIDVAYKSIQPSFDKVNGGFFGPKAAELGGHITSTDGKTGVVFGGKKQANK